MIYTFSSSKLSTIDTCQNVNFATLTGYHPTPACSHQRSEPHGPGLHMLVLLQHGRPAPAQSAEHFHGTRWPAQSSVGSGVMIQGCCMPEPPPPAASPQLHF